MTYRVGICQFEPKLKDKTHNLQKMAEMVKNVRADLLVFPELAVSGYVFSSKEEVISLAENADTGETVRFFKELAAKNNTSYVVGYVEEEQGAIYNACLLVNPDKSSYSYRKIHLFYEEKLWFEQGNRPFRIFPAKQGVRVGMMICFDWMFPEAARSLALQGAQILAHPSNLVLPWAQAAMVTRSLENRVFSLTCNRIGTEVNGNRQLKFTGRSQILSQRGELLAGLDENAEAIAMIDIEPQAAIDKQINDYNNVHRDRRPKMYDLHEERQND